MGIFDFFKSNKSRYNKKAEQGQQYQSVYAVSDDIDVNVVNVDLSEELEDHFLMVHEEDSYACDDMEYFEEHDDCEWEENE